MIFSGAGGLRGLQGMVDLSVPSLSGYRGMVDLGVPSLSGYRGMVDMRIPGLNGMVDMRIPGMSRYSLYGDTASDVGGGVGAGVGSLIKNLFGGGSTPAPAAPTAYLPVAPPSWWAQQTMGTKVLAGGAAFAVLAAGVAFVRGKASKR